MSHKALNHLDFFLFSIHKMHMLIFIHYSHGLFFVCKRLHMRGIKGWECWPLLSYGQTQRLSELCCHWWWNALVGPPWWGNGIASVPHSLLLSSVSYIHIYVWALRECLGRNARASMAEVKNSQACLFGKWWVKDVSYSVLLLLFFFKAFLSSLNF